MASGINSRDRTLPEVLRSLLDRVRRLERPVSIHLGGIGGAVGPVGGYTISVDSAGQLIATSDGGTTTIIALP